MTLLSLEAISKHFGVQPLLEDVTFGLGHDEKMGIIGANGSGKTTLLRIIAGEEPPDGGRVMLAGTPLVAYLPQNPSFDPDTSVLEAVFAGGHERMQLLRAYELACRQLAEAGGASAHLAARVTDLAHRLDVTGGWELEVQAKAILSRLGIPDTQLSMDVLSGGQRKRVALARTLILQPDLLILDEPTNHLDADTITWLEGYLARYTGALLLVTHDRYFLERVTDRMLEIEGGRVQRFEGNYTYYLEKKEEQTLQREAEAQKRENLIRRELAWLRRGAKARTTKQKARIDRAEALMAEPTEGPARKIELSAASTRLGSKVVELENIEKSYDGQTLIAGFSYSLTRSDRVGIIGPNGAGKTTLLEIIAGGVVPDAGRVEVGQTVVVGYYDQESRALAGEMRVIEYVQEVAEYVRTADGTLLSAGQMLERFLFPPALQYTPVDRLSGGERRRLYLLRILMGAPNVLLLDEPTNDLDIPTLVALEDYLDAFPGALVVVSHDRYFLDRTVDHLFRFEGAGHLREYPGNYSAFLEIQDREQAEAARAEAARAARTESTAPEPPARTAPPEEARRLSYKERRELEDLETRIACAEARKGEIEALLSEASSDFEAVSALSTELHGLMEQLDHDVERWAALAERAA